MKTTLYKLDNKNKIREWSIVVEDDSYYTITGIKDGKLITHKPIYAKAKNEGRANETTPQEQALKEVQSIIDKQKTKGYYEDIDEVASGPKHFLVQLAHPYRKHKKKVVFDGENLVFTQPKLDGCVSGDTMVEFDDGTFRSMEDIVNNKIHGNVKCRDVISGNDKYKPIITWARDGVDVNETKDIEWFEIELENGSKLKATGNHLIWLPLLNCYRRVDELDGTESLLFEDISSSLG
jgi:hypothetical protein